MSGPAENGEDAGIMTIHLVSAQRSTDGVLLAKISADSRSPSSDRRIHSRRDKYVLPLNELRRIEWSARGGHGGHGGRGMYLRVLPMQVLGQRSLLSHAAAVSVPFQAAMAGGVGGVVMARMPRSVSPEPTVTQGVEVAPGGGAPRVGVAGMEGRSKSW